jgi:ubiquinone/menaquinone biosynthesis C-methylase UbiE
MKKLLKTLTLAVGIFTIYQVLLRLIRQHWQFPAPAFIGRFLSSPMRARMQPPDLMLERAGLQKEMRVLEIGCGSGAFLPAAARLAGEKGQVFALDIQTNMLTQMKAYLNKPQNQHPDVLLAVQASAGNLPFADNSLDLVYFVAAMFEIPNLPNMLAECRRVLKPGGLIANTEFLPDPDYVDAARVCETLQEAGFQIVHVAGNLMNFTVRATIPCQPALPE